MSGFARVRRLFVTALIAAVLVACGGSAGDGAGTGGATLTQRTGGQVLIGLTDAEGDIGVYEVEVVSVRLTHANGRTFETLPASSRIDFAAYTDLAELVSAAGVAPGRYKAVTLTLDFDGADIRVEDANGDLVPAAAVVDVNGDPLGRVELPLALNGRPPLVVAGGRTSMITLDFDLGASNMVSFETAGPVVTVAPRLAVDLSLQPPRMYRLRGGLAGVDLDAGLISLDLVPLYHAIGQGRSGFGDVDVSTNQDTHYEIQGLLYRGRDGLQALGGLPAGTRVEVRGKPRPGDTRILAREVRAGDPIPGVELDAATGTVQAREGEVLTLNAVFLNRSDHILQRLDRLQVRLDPGATRVLKQLSSQVHSTGDISVGQRVTVFGELNGSDLQGYELDATGGLVRMLLTTAKGTLVSLGSPAVIELQSLGGVRASALDFAGTGIDPTNDADPALYEIDLGTTRLDGLDVGSRLQINGFPVAFGQAADGLGDFQARSVSDLSTAPARLTVSWRDGGRLALDADTLLVDLSGATRFHHLSRAGVVSDLKLMNSQVRVAGREHEGVYLIQARGAPAHHRSFAEFLADLDSRLQAGGRVHRVQAYGDFNDVTASLTASWIKVQLD